jgi:hypothetical protein
MNLKLALQLDQMVFVQEFWLEDMLKALENDWFSILLHIVTYHTQNYHGLFKDQYLILMRYYDLEEKRHLL